MKKTICILACMAVASSVMAVGDTSWRNYSGDNEYTTATNWSVNAVPDGGAELDVDAAQYGTCNMDSEDLQRPNVLFLEEGTFNVLGNTLFYTSYNEAYSHIGTENATTGGTATVNVYGTWDNQDMKGITMGIGASNSALYAADHCHAVLNVYGHARAWNLYNQYDSSAVASGQVNIVGNGSFYVKRYPGTGHVFSDGVGVVLSEKGRMRIEDNGVFSMWDSDPGADTAAKTNQLNAYIASNWLYTTTSPPLGVWHDADNNIIYVAKGLTASGPGLGEITSITIDSL